MCRCTALVAEDRMLAVNALARVATVASMQVARKLEAPVPAPRRLEQIPADRSHRSELRRRRQRASFPERLRDLQVGLELPQRRPGTDLRALDPPRNNVTQADERLGLHDAVPQKRHEIRPARECDRAIPERGCRLRRALRPLELQPSPARAPREAPAASRRA